MFIAKNTIQGQKAEKLSIVVPIEVTILLSAEVCGKNLEMKNMVFEVTDQGPIWKDSMSVPYTRYILSIYTVFRTQS